MTDRRAYQRAYYQRRKAEGRVPDVVKVTLPVEASARLTEEAEACGLTKAAMLRSSFLAYCRQERVLPSWAKEELKNLTLQLRRIGTNLNQVALDYNREQLGVRRGCFDPEEARLLVGQLEDELVAVITKLKGGGG